jgi:transcriptional regulator GlxA family with amidase domain
MITIGIPVYEKVDLLDVAGPYEMFSWVDGFETLIVSADGGPVTTLSRLKFDAHRGFETAPALDVLWVPGGEPDTLGRMMEDPDSPYFDYLRRAAAGARFVCSVCEGALLLGRSGLLDGYRATTHWMFVECLKKFEAIRVDETNPRFVHDRDRLTGGGISSGLDEALKLIELLTDRATAERVQLTTQYFPDPPVSGTIPKAPPCRVHW